MRSRLLAAVGILIITPVVLVLASAAAQQVGGGPPALPQAPLGDIPAVWDVKFTLHDQARRQDRGGALTLRTTDFTGMEYEVRALPDMRVESSGKLRGEFKMVLDSTSPGSHVDQVWQGPQSSKKTLPKPAWKPGQTELLLGRRVEMKNCEKVLDAYTAGSRNMPSNGTPNTFVISSNIQWSPTNWKSTIYVPGPPKTVTVPPIQDGGAILTLPEQEVPYDFRSLVNNNHGQTYTLPSYNFGGFRTVKRTINYAITRKPMSLLYGDPKKSLIGQLEDCKVCKDQYANPNYATGEESGILDVDTEDQKKGDRWTVRHRFIHGNVDIHLLIDGEDVTKFKMEEGGNTSTFELVRLRRDWVWPLNDKGAIAVDKNNKPIGGISLPNDPKTKMYKNGWFDDDPSAGNFKDMPGSFERKPPSEWKPVRETKEFLVAVKGFPEFGFIYYAMTFETQPGQLRFGQSQNATQLHAEEWCERMTKPSSLPFEQPPLGAPVTRFIEWLP